MADEDEKKKEAAIEETPGKTPQTPPIEKPPVLTPEVPGEKPEIPAELPEKGVTTPSEEVVRTLPEHLIEHPPCQWFMYDMKFCNKIKKCVKCGGNVRKCPF